MPTITTADALLTATRDLEETIKGDIPMSQYDKNLVTNFKKLLNAKAKKLQIDEILEERASTEAARAQKVATDAEEEDAVLMKKTLKKSLRYRTHQQPTRDRVQGLDNAL